MRVICSESQVTKEKMTDLETAAKQRKARLQAVKEKFKPMGEKAAEKPKLKFRSYNPHTEELKEGKLPKAKPEEVEPQIQEHLDAAKDSDLGDINLANLAPRKPDWDLKREIKRKLEKLERRTDRAIIELIQEKLKGGEAAGGDLVSAVATAERMEKTDDSQDWD